MDPSFRLAFIERIPSCKSHRSTFFGDASLPVPVLEQCSIVFSKHANETKQIAKSALHELLSELEIDCSSDELSGILNTVKSELLDFGAFCRIIQSIRQRILHQTVNKPSTPKQRASNIADTWQMLGGDKEQKGTVSEPKIKLLLLSLGVAFNVDKHLDELEDNSGIHKLFF